MADGLRRLDGVADVEVDLQANLCTVTPSRDRLLDLAGLPAAVHAAGFRPARLWLEARGVVSERGGVPWFTIAGSEVALRLLGAAGAPSLVVGQVDLGAGPSLTVAAAPR